MDHVIRTMSPESHAIDALCRAAEQAARSGDFLKADACLAFLAADQNGQFFTDAVARFIDRAREQREKAA